jgi:hypothetical protein
MSPDLPPLTTVFHPLNPADTADPFGKLAELRTSCPVSRPQMDAQPELTFFTRYDDVASVYRNYRAWGNMGVSVDVARGTRSSRRTSCRPSPPIRHCTPASAG